MTTNTLPKAPALPLELLRVASTTNVHHLAGSIAHVLRVAPQVELQCIGASAVNQAIKAAAVARSFLKDDGLDLAIQPGFVQVDLGERAAPNRDIVSGIRLVVWRQELA